MEFQEAQLKIHQYLYENKDFSQEELMEIRETILKGK
jgi:hypothetical protein